LQFNFIYYESNSIYIISSELVKNYS